MTLANSRNKRSVLGFQHEPEKLNATKVCFPKERDSPNTYVESRKRQSVTEWYVVNVE